MEKPLTTSKIKEEPEALPVYESANAKEIYSFDDQAVSATDDTRKPISQV